MTIPPGSVHLDRVDAHSFSGWLAGPHPTVILPIGALEQHGPHLPMGTDAMLAGHIADRVAMDVGALVAPLFRFGYKSQQKAGGGEHLTGTTSLDAATLIQLTRDIVRSLLRQGVQHVVLLNGHYENYQFLYEGIDLALRDLDGPADAGRCVLLLSYWDYVSQATLDAVYGDAFEGWHVEHGGVLETSLMLHLESALVDLDRTIEHPPAQLPRFDRFPVVAERTPPSGCLSAPTGSSAGHGRVLFEQVTRDLAADLQAELGLKL